MLLQAPDCANITIRYPFLMILCVEARSDSLLWHQHIIVPFAAYPAMVVGRMWKTPHSAELESIRTQFDRRVITP